MIWWNIGIRPLVALARFATNGAPDTMEYVILGGIFIAFIVWRGSMGGG